MGDKRIKINRFAGASYESIFKANLNALAKPSSRSVTYEPVFDMKTAHLQDDTGGRYGDPKFNQVQLKFNQRTAGDSERFLSSNLTSEQDSSPLGAHLTIDRTNIRMQTANSHPSNRPIPFFATKTPGTDFSFTLNLNSFCQSCLAPNLQLFTAKPQHPGCSQSESWDGPHQPPYEHPKSVHQQ